MGTFIKALQKTYDESKSKSLRAHFAAHLKVYQSVKKTFLFNALVSRYTIYKMDDFLQMKCFSKTIFPALTDIYLDDAPCGIRQTECPLANHIGFKSSKRIMARRWDKKHKSH